MTISYKISYLYKSLSIQVFRSFYKNLEVNLGIVILMSSYAMRTTYIIFFTILERTEGDEMEGMLVRKHEWENTTKKAPNR